jgi:hypothetical protein
MNESGRGAYRKRGRNKQNARSDQQQEKPQAPAKGRNSAGNAARSSPPPQQFDAPAKNKRRGDQKKYAPKFAEKRKLPEDRNRPKWVPPTLLTSAIPKPECPVCGKPIDDLASAINDKISGRAAHFDCIRGKIAAGEPLGKGEVLSYIGGGRFGVVNFDGQEKRYFKIKKVIEWEVGETRADWREDIAGHYSIT